ncbi:STAS domain-containing protein [Streptomyces ficellus]|uniref:STAS domain-containing protein n=1 Tax=Streptomyces ficellus TaxID=1977088 RepID=A0ABT7Z152_9ACTN|nr:STAS domain-containing protein [Streptomyces ficellus]MDN3293220.1 STAS domain-containing protein [Streptomyces ficellus]
MAELPGEDGSRSGRPRCPLVAEEDESGDVGLVHVRGQVYLDTLMEWERILGGLRGREGDIHMDLSGLTFVDVAGASSLARTAQSLPGGRRILIESPPASLSRVLEMFWPELVSIEVAK